MSSAMDPKAVKVEPKEEDPDIKIEHQVYTIDQKVEQKPELATIQPLRIPVDSCRPIKRSHLHHRRGWLLR